MSANPEAIAEVKGEKVCPFCGAQYRTGSRYFTEFNCGSYYDKQDKTWLRVDKCYNRQLAQQAELLRQALEISNELIGDKELEIISHHSPDCGRDYYFCSICGVEAETEGLIVHQGNCLYLKLIALIPALEKALEVVK